MIKKSVTKKLKSIVGEKNTILEKEELEAFSIDNVLPEIVLSPDNIEQVSEIMKLASKESLSVIPWGSGTKSDLGNKPDRVDIVISTNNLNRIIEHEASDLVATTQSGISLSSLQKELNKENQFLALDPPHINKDATIGGIIATNDSGPERLRYGTAREFLIGIKVVKADGSIFKGGSKVVKNVAGYDLPKLYVGSLGTLGIIVEATFRLYPVPEYSETYVASFSSLENCHKTILTLLNSNLVLTSLELLNPGLATLISKRNNLDINDSEYCLAIGIKNVEKAVKDQIFAAKKISEQNGGNGLLISGSQEEKLWEDVRNFPWDLVKAESVVCKVGILVTQIPAVLNMVKQLSDENGVEIFVSTRAGNGICIIAIRGEGSSITNALNDMRDFISTFGGSLVIQEASTEIKEQFDIWGDIGSGLGIMKRIKSNFDPDNILNPGRYI
ncbi:MAG: glycolate oxidase [Thermodesulfobacteriota bacterium]|nr:MAG: glycolate oxidase [Thermodesulfobacteriota bacterium]